MIRHGPMVFGICRNVLQNVHDAQDAFQAVFLVLANRSRSIRRKDSVASWLFGVAQRVAARARSRAARRRAIDQTAAERVTECYDDPNTIPTEKPFTKNSTDCPTVSRHPSYSATSKV